MNKNNEKTIVLEVDEKERMRIEFVRVSTGHQKLSISNQIAEITDYCKNTDELELIDILQEEAVSGDAVVRTGFDTMLEMVDKKQIDGIICLNLSRIGRKAAQTLDLINKCMKYIIR